MSHSAHTAAHAAPAPQLTININSQDVSLPRKYAAGYEIDETEALILDTFRGRQFANNQNALAKARTEGKNKTAQPTAQELAALFVDYMPSIGDTPRASTMETMRAEAAWNHWANNVATPHNLWLETSGAEGTEYPKANGAPISLRWTAQKDSITGATISAADRKANFVARLLAAPQFAEGIEAELARLTAQRGKGTEKSTAAPMDNLL